MSSPGDPFDPSLDAGFGQRDPDFQVAPFFANPEDPFAEIYACLVQTDLAWSAMKDAVYHLRDAADRLQRVANGAENRDLIEAKEALSASVWEVEQARFKAQFGYRQGMAFLRSIGYYG